MHLCVGILIFYKFIGIRCSLYVFTMWYFMMRPDKSAVSKATAKKYISIVLHIQNVRQIPGFSHLCLIVPVPLTIVKYELKNKLFHCLILFDFFLETFATPNL